MGEPTLPPDDKRPRRIELPFPWEWRYTTMGTRRHAVNTSFRAVVSECGVSVWGFDFWLGTGNQPERDKLESLPECLSCIRRLERGGVLSPDAD